MGFRSTSHFCPQNIIAAPAACFNGSASGIGPMEWKIGPHKPLLA
jgi:hypothetical protein